MLYERLIQGPVTAASYLDPPWMQPFIQSNVSINAFASPHYQHVPRMPLVDTAAPSEHPPSTTIFVLARTQADSVATTYPVGRVTCNLSQATAPTAWAAIHQTKLSRVRIFNRSLTKMHCRVHGAQPPSCVLVARRCYMFNQRERGVQSVQSSPARHYCEQPPTYCGYQRILGNV